MPTPFPGMDPYLEQRGVWNQVHTSLIVDIQRFLTPRLRPKYHVGIEQRTYLALLPPSDDLVGIPDALVVASGAGMTMVAPALSTVAPEIGVLPQPEEMRERYLEIRALETQQVVTVIELLSPGNKLSREGRAEYERKRLDVLSRRTNLVEIDLLRASKPFPMQASRQSDYRIVISRNHQRPPDDQYLFDLPQPIPDIPIPLQPHETEPMLPLGALLHHVYDEGGYDLIVDYSRPADPPLREADAAWAHDLLGQTRQNGQARRGDASA
jgi:hypothetical protein